jgi:hypothetical protein
LTVFPSTEIERVANSTPIVDFDSRLNSLRVNRERTVVRRQSGCISVLSPVLWTCVCVCVCVCLRSRVSRSPTRSCSPSVTALQTTYGYCEEMRGHRISYRLLIAMQPVMVDVRFSYTRVSDQDNFLLIQSTRTHAHRHNQQLATSHCSASSPPASTHKQVIVCCSVRLCVKFEN